MEWVELYYLRISKSSCDVKSLAINHSKVYFFKFNLFIQLNSPIVYIPFFSVKFSRAHMTSIHLIYSTYTYVQERLIRYDITSINIFSYSVYGQWQLELEVSSNCTSLNKTFHFKTYSNRKTKKRKQYIFYFFFL